MWNWNFGAKTAGGEDDGRQGNTSGQHQAYADGRNEGTATDGSGQHPGSHQRGPGLGPRNAAS